MDRFHDSIDLSNSYLNSVKNCQVWANEAEFKVTGFNGRRNTIFSNFSALHLNAGTGGLRKSGQLETLADFLEDEGSGLDAVVVSETWLKKVDYGGFGIADFSFVGSGREDSRQGGGVGVYIRSQCVILETVTRSSGDGNVQAIRLLVRKPGFEGYVIGFYSAHFMFRDTLLDILEDIVPRCRKPCVIMGDSNINLLAKSFCEDYMAFFWSRNFQFLIDKVTRPASGTCIDHIAIKNCEDFLDISSAVWCTPLFSDHFPVAVTVTGRASVGSSNVSPCSPKLVRRHDGDSIRRFTENTGKLSWLGVYDAVDVDEAFGAFSLVLEREYIKCFTAIETKMTWQQKRFQFNTRLKSMRHTVNKLHRFYRKVGSKESKEAFYFSLRKYRLHVKSARTAFYKRQFNSLKRDSKRLWNFLKTTCGQDRQRAALPKSIVVEGRTVDEPQVIANELNRHFALVGSRTVAALHAEDDIMQELDSIWSVQGPMMMFSDTNFGVVKETLDSTKANWSCGAAGVPSMLLKLSSASLAGPLTHIINLSLRSGRFPVRLKDATVIPLFKNKGDRKDVVNYRPISLIDYLSKVFEKIVMGKLKAHLRSLNFFSATQFGFRKARSTELALAHMWQEITDAIEKKLLCLGVFLDISAAFNCLRHSYFLQALECLGCGTKVVEWFESYLAARRQAVKADGVESDWCVLDIGTPQGSILGPFMFIILFNFVLLKISAVGCGKAIAYADDTSLLFRVRPTSLQHDIQTALAKVEDMIGTFEKFGFVINAKKTNISLFRLPQRTVQVVPVQLCGEMLPWSESVKCLGITLHDTLKWHAHLQSFQPKCYAVIAMLRRLRELGIPTEGLLKLYNALLVPLLCYGLAVWGGGYKSLLRRGEVVQNDAIRVIFGKRRSDSVTDLMGKYSLPKLRALYAHHVALLAFKMSRGIIPADIAFPIVAVNRRTARRPTEFVIPFATRESSRHALACRLPTVWTSLPREIRSLKSAKKFAEVAKQYFVNNMK